MGVFMKRLVLSLALCFAFCSSAEARIKFNKDTVHLPGTTPDTYSVSKTYKMQITTFKYNNTIFCIVPIDVSRDGKIVGDGIAICKAQGKGKCPNLQACVDDNSVPSDDIIYPADMGN